MARNILRKGLTFRDKFAFPSKDTTQYFPGHMNKGINQIQRRLKDVDCIIEVHDARIPFSGRNPYFHDQVIAARPHILLFSKVDLADLTHENFIKQYYENQGVSKVLFANCYRQVDKTIKKQLIPAVTEAVESNPRYERTETPYYNVLVIGIPNVGKSSLINAMRREHLKKGKATHVGAEAGVTRSIQTTIKVCERPPIQILDTPGILSPRIPDPNVGMKLALCANMKDHLVGEYMIADYMLFWLNQFARDEYVDYFHLQGPTDDVNELLFCVARHNQLITKRKPLSKTSGEVYRPDFERAAIMVIKAFRQGNLGKVNLDQGLIEKMIQGSKEEDKTIRDALKQRESERLKIISKERTETESDIL